MAESVYSQTLAEPSQLLRTCAVHAGETFVSTSCFYLGAPVSWISTEKDSFSHLCEDFYYCSVYYVSGHLCSS